MSAGTLQIQATIDSAITVDSGGLLDATSSFTAPLVTTTSGATLVIESTADVTLSAPITIASGTTLNDRISSTSNGEIIAEGSSVDLIGLTLSIQTVSYTPTLGQIFTLISNQTGSPVTGTFSGLAQGDVTEVSGTYYQVNYDGGSSGHDVTLTVVNAPAVWTDGAHNNNWNTAANWQGDAVPTSGQSIELASPATTIVVSGNVTVGTIEFDGSFVLSGGTITVSGSIIANVYGITIESILHLNHNTTITVNAGDSISTFTMPPSGSFGIIKQGSGLLQFLGAEEDNGIVEVAAGTLEPADLVLGGLDVDSGATLEETSPTVVGSGIVFNIGSTIQESINQGSTSEITADSSVNLSNPTLVVSPASAYVPPLGTVFTLINNMSGIPVTGIFNGLPQGAVAEFSGSYYQISYNAGSSNDNVTLTVVAQPVASSLSIAQQPSEAAAGQVLGNLVVDVLDQYGNILSSDTSTMTLTAVNTTDEQIVALNGTTSMNASSGMATFSNLSLDTAATYTISISDSDGMPVASVNNIIVTPAAATQLAFLQQPVNTVAGQTMPPIEVEVQDQFGNVVTNNNSGVVVQNFPNVLNGTITSGFSNGIATFSDLCVTQAGTYTINASDASLTAVNSSSFTVTPAAAAQLAFVQQPVNTIAGQTMAPIEVAVEDQYGNIVTNNDSGVVVQNSPNFLNGTISAGVSNGIATFSDLYVTQAGTYTINASDASLTAINSSSFTVTPAAAAQLAFVQQPANTIAGQTMAPIEVAVQDQYGNTVTSNDSGVVVQTIPNVLNGTLSAWVVNGIATFSNLDITQAGAYTINASNGSLTPATSSSFTITPATPTTLVITRQNSSATAGQPIGNVTVDVEDAYGNIVTSDPSDVTITATSTGVAMPASVLTGITTFAPQNGVAVFSNLSISLGGAYILHAADADLTATSPITITNIASHTIPAGQTLPSMAIASTSAFGQSIAHDKSLTVQVKNQSTGVVAIDKTVHVSHGKATISNLKIQKTGNYVMVVSDGQGHTMMQTYTVQPGSASRLVFAAQPTFTDDAASVSVNVLDAYGNQTTAADGETITLKLAAHSTRHPSLTGTLTASVVDGQAVFADVQIDPGDHARLTAIAKKLRPAVSAVFTIN